MRGLLDDGSNSLRAMTAEYADKQLFWIRAMDYMHIRRRTSVIIRFFAFRDRSGDEYHRLELL